MNDITNSDGNGARDRGWLATVQAFLHPRVVTMLFLGFSAGLPLLLIFSSLSLWLREAGMERSVVTFFSWAALGYSFKFVWAPLVDSLPLPFLTRMLGRRRAWILLAQAMIIVAIYLMASIDPAVGQNKLALLAIAAVMLGFSSATQDIVIDAYRIESAEPQLQALMSSTYIAGYRVGMLVAGAGALYLASGFGSTLESYSYAAWSSTYKIMAMFMLVGVATTLIIPEPATSAQIKEAGTAQHVQVIILFVCCVAAFIFAYTWTSGVGGQISAFLKELTGNRALGGAVSEFVRLLSALSAAVLVSTALIRTTLVPHSVVKKLYLDPVLDFFRRYGTGFAVLLLLLIGCYRISDIVMGIISNVFYQDMGFTKSQIASASKVFGLWMTLLGGFLGGILAVRAGVVKILLLGAVMAAATNLLFMLLSQAGQNLTMLYLVIGADNISGGLASAAFVAFLSALTNVRFSAMQFAIFTSFMTLIPKILGGYSGSMVDTMGYGQFFLFTAILGIPVIIIIVLVARRLDI